MTTPHHHIRDMAPYALAEMRAPDGVTLTSLSQNESLRGPSPQALAAATGCLAAGSDYPDPDWTDLRAALAKLHGISAQNILCGSGSLDLINCLMRVYAGPDSAVLAPTHAYPFFRTAAQMAQARFDAAVEKCCVVDVDALLAGVRPDTGIVCVANPGNPTGTRIPRAELARLRAGLRDDILLLIDEAYAEFTDHLGEPCWQMVESGNCIVLRTFSKAYSMAGFRIGWGLFPDHIAAQLRKVMNPNGVSHIAQVAATTAVLDQRYMQQTCMLTSNVRKAAFDALTNAGFDVVPSVTNFLLIRFDSADSALSADNTLRAAGVFLRRQQGAGLPHALRMTVGPVAATQKATDILTRWQEEQTI